MGRKGTAFRCVRKRKYTPALRKANEARKNQKTAINSCPVTVDIENVDTKATIPIAEVSSSDEPLMQPVIEIDTTMTIEKNPNIVSDSTVSLTQEPERVVVVCKMVRRKSQLSRDSAKAKQLRLLRRKESEDENMKRLEKQRLVTKNNRLRESSAERFKRLNEHKDRMANKRAQMKYILKSAAFLKATANCSALNGVNIDKKNKIRKKIEVPKFETGPGKCCSSGKFAARTDIEGEVQTKAECDSLECRACLQIMNADSVLYNIFESWTPPWDGMENSIGEDLAKIANLQISETDRHSKVICETCYELLLNACNFTAIVKKNDQILRQRYGDDTTEQNSFNQKVWPKPIQVDKSLPTMYDNPMSVEIKQEVPSDEENEYPVLNGTYETSREEIPNIDIIKIEPEEMIQQQPLQIKVTVNGSIPSEELDNKETHLTNGNSDNGECDRIRHNGSLRIISMDLPSRSSPPDSSSNIINGKPQHFFTKNGTISKRKKYDLSKAQRKEIKKIKNMESKYMVKPGCNIEVCKKKCHTHFTEEKRKKLNIFFRNLSWKEQQYFILNNTSKEEPKRKTIIDNRKLPRNKSISYFLLNESGNKVKVCKVFFLETLGFNRKNDSSVRNALELPAHEMPVDRRGTNPNPSKVDDTNIIEHINSFNPTISHYRTCAEEKMSSIGSHSDQNV